VLGTSSDVIPSHRRAAAPSPWPPLPYTLGSPLLSPTPYGLNPISKERCPAPHYGGEQGEAATGSWGGRQREEDWEMCTHRGGGRRPHLTAPRKAPCLPMSLLGPLKPDTTRAGLTLASCASGWHPAGGATELHFLGLRRPPGLGPRHQHFSWGPASLQASPEGPDGKKWISKAPA
jgi:hypothetical protein